MKILVACYPLNIYRKQEKIRWATDSTQWSFSEKNFHSALHLKHLNNAIIRSLYIINKHSQKNFHSTVENREERESLAQQIFAHLQ